MSEDTKREIEDAVVTPAEVARRDGTVDRQWMRRARLERIALGGGYTLGGVRVSGDPESDFNAWVHNDDPSPRPEHLGTPSPPKDEGERQILAEIKRLTRERDDARRTLDDTQVELYEMRAQLHDVKMILADARAELGAERRTSDAALARVDTLNVKLISFDGNFTTMFGWWADAMKEIDDLKAKLAAKDEPAPKKVDEGAAVMRCNAYTGGFR